MNAGTDMVGSAHETPRQDVDVSAEGATGSAGSVAFEEAGDADSNTREATHDAQTITITGPNFVPQDPYRITR